MLSSKRVFVGLLVLGIGVMLLLDTTDALGEDTSVFGTYWPALLIALALWRLTARGFRFTLLPLVILTVGIVFLLAELEVGSLDIGKLWPVILVVLGLSIVLRGAARRRRGWRRFVAGGNVSNLIGGGARGRARGAGDGEVRAIFGGAEKRITSQNLKDLQVTAVFGGVELDLTEARLAGEKATLNVTVVFGGAQLKVPPTWTVRVETTPLAGEVKNERRQPAPGEATGELVIAGTVAFGGITVE